MYYQSNNWWRFLKTLWPSQNIWTLPSILPRQGNWFMKKVNTRKNLAFPCYSLQTPQLYRFYSGWYDGGVVGLTGESPPLSSLQFNWERLWLCWSKNINPTSLLEPRVRHKTHKNFMDIAFWNSFLPSLVILRNKRQFFVPDFF